MAQLDRTQLKALFENGDIPTQDDFANLIDSLALKSEVGNDTLSTSTITYDLIKSEHSKLLPYLCFNHIAHDGGRGVLGVCGSIPSDDVEYTNSHYNNGLDFNIWSSVGADINGSTVFGPNSTQIDTSTKISYTFTSLIQNDNDPQEDNNGNIYYYNPQIPTLEYLMPIIATGVNPKLSISSYNFYEPPYISDNNIIPTTNSPYCITAKEFNRPISINKLSIMFEGMEEDSGNYYGIQTAIVDFNYNINAIASDITIESGGFTIDIPVSTGFAESVTNSVTSYQFYFVMSGVTLDDNEEFEISDGWYFDDDRLLEDWYHSSSDMDISTILNDSM